MQANGVFLIMAALASLGVLAIVLAPLLRGAGRAERRASYDMQVYRDEVFGPVLAVVRVGTFEDALGLVNSNEYGNGAAIFTRSGAAARQFEEEVTAGMVGINVPIPVPAAHFSFGGWKSSLFGDLHAYGPDGIRFFTRGKVVTSRWPEPTPGVDLAFPRG